MKIFERREPILLYWFAAQQQTNRSREQKVDLFYPKFSPELDDFALAF